MDINTQKRKNNYGTAKTLAFISALIFFIDIVSIILYIKVRKAAENVGTPLEKSHRLLGWCYLIFAPGLGFFAAFFIWSASKKFRKQNPDWKVEYKLAKKA